MSVVVPLAHQLGVALTTATYLPLTAPTLLVAFSAPAGLGWLLMESHALVSVNYKLHDSTHNVTGS